MFCSSCGSKIQDAARFCTQCGTPTGLGTEISSGSSSSISDRQRTTRGPSELSRAYSNVDQEKLEATINRIKSWLDIEGFEVESSSDGSSQSLLQIRKKGQWKRFVGLSTALAIKIVHSNGCMNVEIGQGHWGSKLASGGVSMFVLWPLAVTTAIGTAEQLSLPKKILKYIDSIM